MVTRSDVDGFIGEKSLAIVGVSRHGKKFGNTILKELSAKGYAMFPVHPEADSVDGVKAYPSLSSLPEKVGGAIVCVPPAKSTQVVKDAAAHGIRRIWLQQGAESPEAIAFCDEQGLSVVHGHCILMFAEPAALPHRIHGWIWRILGKVPR